MNEYALNRHIEDLQDDIDNLQLENAKLKQREAELAKLLGIIFDKYETGESCYDMPDDPGGVYIGNAVRLDDETFHRIVNVLAKGGE